MTWCDDLSSYVNVNYEFLCGCEECSES